MKKVMEGISRRKVKGWSCVEIQRAINPGRAVGQKAPGGVFSWGKICFKRLLDMFKYN